MWLQQKGASATWASTYTKKWGGDKIGKLLVRKT